MKKTLVILLLCCSTQLLAQRIYSSENLNLTSPNLIKTSDGGYLINTDRSAYTPNSTPHHFNSQYRLMKVDDKGNVEWSLLDNNFSPHGMFECSDESFVGINDRYTSGWFVCKGVGTQNGYEMYFTKVDADGNVLQQFEINPGCRNKMGDVIQFGVDKFIVACNFDYGRNGMSHYLKNGQLFFIDDIGEITNHKEFYNVSYSVSNLFISEQNEINLIYENEDDYLMLARFDSVLNRTSLDTLGDVDELFRQYAKIREIETELFSNGNMSVAVTYQDNNYDFFLKVFTYDTSLSIVSQYDYSWARYSSNRLDYEASDDFIMASTVNDSIGNSDIQLNIFDQFGQKTDSVVLDIISNTETVSSLIFDEDGELIIAGSYNCCNKDTIVGPAKSFVSFSQDDISVTSEVIPDYAVQIYPNPTNGLFKLDLKREQGIATIIIRNALGQSVKKLILREQMTLIDLTDEKKGIYLVEITTGSRKVTERLVIYD